MNIKGMILVTETKRQTIHDLTIWKLKKLKSD